jgi:hypothetical protein
VRSLPYYIALGLSLAASSLAAGGFGSTGALLMAEGLAVRNQGLGQAFSALADDEASLQVNPAGLARQQGLSIGGGHVLGLLDDHTSYLHGAWRAGANVGLGLQAAYASVDDEARDVFGNFQGTFSDRQILGGLGLGFTVAPGWRLGLAGKALQEDLGGSTSLALAGDLGLQVDLPRGWSAGASLLNVGSEDTGTERLSTPVRVQAGVSAPFFSPRWQVEADLQDLPVEEQARLLVGTEISFDLNDALGPDAGPSAPQRLRLRAGGQFGFLKQEAARLSLGAGIGFGPNFTLDYALQDLGVLGQTHRFSLSLRFLQPGSAHPDGPVSTAMSAPYGLQVTPQFDGLLISWQHDDKAVLGYNLYSDYGVLVERLNNEPLSKNTQRFIKVTRSRTYNFYVRPIGSDGKEGPPSQIKTVRIK